MSATNSYWHRPFVAWRRRCQARRYWDTRRALDWAEHRSLLREEDPAAWRATIKALRACAVAEWALWRELRDDNG